MLEIGCTSLNITLETGTLGSFRPAGLSFWYIFFAELGLLALSLSALFQASTIMRCKDGLLLRQQFSFLGGCTPIHPPYTPRGEAASIVFARAVIINQSVCAPAILLPFIDFIWVVPQFAQASMGITTLASPPSSWQAGSRNISFNTSTSLQTNGNKHQLLTRRSRFVWHYHHRVGDPRMCTHIGGPLDVDPADIHWLRIAVKADDRYGRDKKPEPTPVLRGANLFGMVTWTKRQVRTQALWPTYLHRTLHPFITALPAALPRRHHRRRSPQASLS
ncbi:hypothetical protein B0H16DRAFT_1904104 [Mycena metata]|uniref:Uncharacterized protein n=1 Tax=Mycena metata TaxID=1033252 RepID=A0AAD7DMI3_9AGAR|nr:hypothetical protein B0H16DRAFT_1904104 [Mycena metata]